MAIHPQAAVDRTAVFLGQSGPLANGWNRIFFGEPFLHEELFVFVGPDGGVTTPVRPDVPSESIHPAQHVSSPFRESPLWRAAGELADRVVSLDLSDWPEDRVRKVIESIRETAEGPVPVNAAVVGRDRIVAAVQAMREAVRSTGKEIRHATVLEQAVKIAEAYTAFELPGVLAAELLAVVLSVQCNFPSFGPPSNTSSQCRRHALEHLAKLSYALLKRRGELRLSSFLEVSYLANLYTGAALKLAAHEAEVGSGEDVGGVPLDRLAQNLDEQLAHEIIPTFDLPAFLSLGVVGLHVLAARTQGQKRKDVWLSYGMHPAMRELVWSRSDENPRWDRLLADYPTVTASMPAVDVEDALRGEYSPIARENVEMIMMQFLSLSLGRSMRV
jgi:hypothetical protein